VTQASHPVELPIQCLFLMPQEVMNYASLPDLGIFIRGKLSQLLCLPDWLC
jgi:hypothetical protein